MEKPIMGIYGKYIWLLYKLRIITLSHLTTDNLAITLTNGVKSIRAAEKSFLEGEFLER